ncbi:MAG: DUF4258 domain-containing protein [PVC group bacterium]
MYGRVLNRIRQLVLERRYIVTVHAYDEMGADNFAIWDVESALLNGTIVGQQRDKDTGERKFRVAGEGLNNRKIEVVVKVGATGKLIIITVYAL